MNKKDFRKLGKVVIAGIKRLGRKRTAGLLLHHLYEPARYSKPEIVGDATNKVPAGISYEEHLENCILKIGRALRLLLNYATSSEKATLLKQEVINRCENLILRLRGEKHDKVYVVEQLSAIVLFIQNFSSWLSISPIKDPSVDTMVTIVNNWGLEPINENDRIDVKRMFGIANFLLTKVLGKTHLKG